MPPRSGANTSTLACWGANEPRLSSALLAIAPATGAVSLNTVPLGKILVRCGDALLVIPSGMPDDRCTVADMVWMDMDVGARRYRSLSEWTFHRYILDAGPEVHAEVHAYATPCTMLICLERRIHLFHDMITVVSGPDIRCGALTNSAPGKCRTRRWLWLMVSAAARSPITV